MAEAINNGDDSSGDENMDMAALLAAEEVQMHSLHRGEVIEGTVVGRDRDGVIVNESAGKAAFQSVLKAIPITSMFVPLL